MWSCGTVGTTFYQRQLSLDPGIVATAKALLLAKTPFSHLLNVNDKLLHTRKTKQDFIHKASIP